MNSEAPVARYYLGQRTPGEELWLWRRRQFSTSGRQRSKIGSGMSQAEAANTLGTVTQKYHDAEASRLPEREVRLLLALTGADMNPAPSQGELCALARRRACWTLMDTAKALGVSRVTFLERERSGAEDVMRLWIGQGFVF